MLIVGKIRIYIFWKAYSGYVDYDNVLFVGQYNLVIQVGMTLKMEKSPQLSSNIFLSAEN